MHRRVSAEFADQMKLDFCRGHGFAVFKPEPVVPDKPWSVPGCVSPVVSLLEAAGLAYFSGNHGQPAALVLLDERRFRRRFMSLACRDAAMDTLGSGILIRRDVERCA
jgi:hypothetical protein